MSRRAVLMGHSFDSDRLKVHGTHRLEHTSCDLPGTWWHSDSLSAILGFPPVVPRAATPAAPAVLTQGRMTDNAGAGDALVRQLQAALGDAYTIDRELGGGGMSRVFLATEAALGRKVVIKLLPPELAAGVSSDRF